LKIVGEDIVAIAGRGCFDITKAGEDTMEVVYWQWRSACPALEVVGGLEGLFVD